MSTAFAARGYTRITARVSRYVHKLDIAACSQGLHRNAKSVDIYILQSTRMRP